MTNKPDYYISIRDGGEIVLVRKKDSAVFSGNYETDDKFREFCDILSFKSKTRKCIAEERDNPVFEVKTTISSVECDNDGAIRVNVPKNPFMGSFAVNSDDFQFSEGQNVWYTDSNPPQMLIGDEKKSTIIIQHYKMGWMSKNKYDYYQLNEASRAIYDVLIKETDHNKLYSYLQDVEKIYKGEDATFLSSKSIEYREKATALAKKYKEINRKSIMRKDEFRLMHPEEVKNSGIVQSAKDYVPSHIATSLKLPNILGSKGRSV
jgi:hypothetical protein